MFHLCVPYAPATEHGAARIEIPGRRRLTVDIHCHYTSQRADDFALPHRKADSEAMLAFAGGQERTEHTATIKALDLRIRGTEKRLAEMDAMGVDVQVISPGPMQYFYWLPPELGREASRMVNDDIAEIASRHPDRLVAMGTAPLQHPEFAVAELERCVKQLGLRAMEINTCVNGTELSQAGLETFFAKVEEYGVVLFIHPLGFTDGRRMARHFFINTIGNPLESTLAIGHLIHDGVLDRYPGLKICVAHGGGYIAHYVGRFDHTYEHRPEVHKEMKKAPSAYLRQLYFDTVVYDPAEIEQLARRWGAEHVLMGTDWPYNMGERDPVGLLDRCSAISEDDRAKIAGRNAAALFGIKDRTTASR
jgi:aminocarboxymuconate-semialdehyde decarboxylase